MFWSHMKQVDVTREEAAQGVVDSWLVTNKSIDHPAAPLGQGGCLQVELTVCFLCQTMVSRWQPPPESTSHLVRQEGHRRQEE